MTKVKDTFGTIGRGGTLVPDNYFDELKDRLSAIPAERYGRVPDAGILRKARPYLALAASLLVAAVLGDFILDRTGGIRSGEDVASEILLSDVVCSSSDEALFLLSETESEQLSEEDIISFLIESGATENQLACLEAAE